MARIQTYRIWHVRSAAVGSINECQLLRLIGHQVNLKVQEKPANTPVGPARKDFGLQRQFNACRIEEGHVCVAAEFALSKWECPRSLANDSAQLPQVR